jgi:hypothetical protein
MYNHSDIRSTKKGKDMICKIQAKDRKTDIPYEVSCLHKADKAAIHKNLISTLFNKQNNLSRRAMGTTSPQSDLITLLKTIQFFQYSNINS